MIWDSTEIQSCCRNKIKAIMNLPFCLLNVYYNFITVFQQYLLVHLKKTKQNPTTIKQCSRTLLAINSIWCTYFDYCHFTEIYVSMIIKADVQDSGFILFILFETRDYLPNYYTNKCFVVLVLVVIIVDVTDKFQTCICCKWSDYSAI